MKNPEQSLRGKLNGDDYVHERTAWIRAQRQITELKLAQEERRLVDVDLCMSMLCQVISAVKQAILAVPAVVAPSVSPADASRAESVIYQALYEAFDGISEEKIARIIDQACAAAASGDKAAAALDDQPVGGRRAAAKPRVKRKPRKVAN
jgi:hypothetical protein